MPVVFSKNSLVPHRDRVEFQLINSIKADELLKTVRVPDAIIDVDGKVLLGDLSLYEIKPKDMVKIYSQAYGGGNGRGVGKIIAGAIIIAVGIITAPYTGGASSYIIGFGISLVVGGIASFLIKKPLTPSLQGSGGQPAISSFEISSGQNNFRAGQSLPICMGKIRFFPDFGSQPFVESSNLNVNTETLKYVAFRKTISYPTYSDPVHHIHEAAGFNPFDRLMPYFSQPPTGTYGTTLANSWVLVTAASSGYGYDVYVDKMSWDTFAAISTNAVSIQDDIDNNGTIVVNVNWFGPGQDGLATWKGWIYHHVNTDPLYQKYQATTDFLNSIAGGTDPGKVQAPILEEAVVDLVFATVNPRFDLILSQIFNFGYGDMAITDDRIESTDITTYRDVNLYNPTKTATNWLIASPGPDSNVDTTEGSKLVNNSTFAYPNNWIQREGPDHCFAIQCDLGGKLFAQNTSTGIIANTRQFQLQYRLVGSPTWLDMDVPTIQISRSVTDDFRFTFDVFVTPGKYEVRAAKVSADETDANYICDVDLIEVRWFKQDSADYVGQNRKAIKIKANEQLNGRIGKYNALVDCKCWVLIGDIWSWQSTSNPAWWFLYFARGGWKNPTGVTTASPTTGWQNGIAAGNTDILFGCGLDDSRIDFDSITLWAAFCDDQDLEFDVGFDEDRNAQDILTAITAVGRGSPSWSKGRLGVVWEQATDQPIAMYGMANILRGSFSVNYVADQVPDKIIGTYFDQDNNYEAAQVEINRPYLVGNPKTSTEVPLLGITRAAQAERETRILASRQYFQRRTMTWDADADGLIVQRGDVISLSHDCLQWGRSGRIISFQNDGINVTSFVASNTFDKNYGWVQIRTPENDLLIYECSTLGNVVTMVDPWPLTLAPYYIGQGTEINSFSNFKDSFPEDFMWLTDVKETPGKMVRIISVVPKNEHSMTLTAVDFDPAMWAYEFGDPGTAQVNSNISARVYGLNIVSVVSENYNFKLCWELEGAWAVKIDVSENGGAFVPYIQNGSNSVFGDTAFFNYPTAGTKVDIRVTPIVAGTPYSSTIESISYEVPLGS